MTVDTTFTTVRYDSKKKDVSVAFLGEDDSLVGVEFLEEMKFCLDLKERKIELH